MRAARPEPPPRHSTIHTRSRRDRRRTDFMRRCNAEFVKAVTRPPTTTRPSSRPTP
ncbi:hypothetical protein ACR6C2_07985 [Streptomyces sp. INA 01156]